MYITWGRWSHSHWIISRGRGHIDRRRWSMDHNYLCSRRGRSGVVNVYMPMSVSKMVEVRVVMVVIVVRVMRVVMVCYVMSHICSVAGMISLVVFHFSPSLRGRAGTEGGGGEE